MKISVIGGTGYVGLVTGIGLAVYGNDVICADINEKNIHDLNKGILPIYEKGLDELLMRANTNKKIKFTTCIKTAVVESEIIIIAVGTPENRYGDTDLSQIIKAVKSVVSYITEYKIIVIKSTVPVGTCELVARILNESLKNVSFDVVSNPEFLREGEAVQDFMSPERIVIGADSPKAAAIMNNLYNPFNVPLIISDTRSSEMIKYACNSYLASRISFINEIAEICEVLDADVNTVLSAMKLDKRIGGNYLAPGPGFGGPCLSKDLKSLINFAERANANVDMLKAVLRRNELQIENIMNHIITELSGLNNIRISVLGLSYKAGTDDTRNSPAVHLIERLLARSMNVSVYDPVVKIFDGDLMSRVKSVDSVEAAALKSDCLVIMTDWQEFKHIDLKKLYGLMYNPIIIDTRNIIPVKTAITLGFRYKGIGVGSKRRYEYNIDDLRNII